jgi:hypothetical protein
MIKTEFMELYEELSELIKDDKSLLVKCANEARNYITAKYGDGTDLCGKCIEASDYLCELLNSNGIEATTVEGYIIYDDDSNCSDRAWDEHTWVELSDGTVVDVTIEQFNPMMYQDYPAILIEKDPYNYVYDRPDFNWLDELDESVKSIEK